MTKKYTLVLSIAAFLLGGCGESEFHAKHNQGRNCLECHGFKGGGTIFNDLHRPNLDYKNAADAYNIQLLLENGDIITFEKGNGYGNRKYSGDISAIDRFTPQIVDKNGTVVNQSRPNSHDSSRFACNRCHTQEGANGAPGRIVNFDYYGTLGDQLDSNQTN